MVESIQTSEWDVRGAVEICKRGRNEDETDNVKLCAWISVWQRPGPERIPSLALERLETTATRHSPGPPRSARVRKSTKSYLKKPLGKDYLGRFEFTIALKSKTDTVLKSNWHLRSR